MAKTNTCCMISLCCGAVVFLVLMILLITSFVYVEYDEYAFKKSTISNTVDQSTVHETGRYVWGFEHTKVSFPRLYQLIELNLTVANAEGVSLGVKVSFWYRLPKDNLSKIYSKYGVNYETQIQSISRAVIRNTAVQFSVNDFLSKRALVTSTIAHNITRSLYAKVFVEVPKYSVQLNSVKFTETLLKTHLNAAIQLENNEQKEYEQNATLTRIETEKLVQEYTSNTTIIQRTAQANKTAEINKAETKYDEIIGQARGLGIAETIDILGMDDKENVTQKFLKLMAILDNDNAQIVDITSSAIVNLPSSATDGIGTDGGI